MREKTLKTLMIMSCSFFTSSYVELLWQGYWEECQRNCLPSWAEWIKWRLLSSIFTSSILVLWTMVGPHQKLKIYKSKIVELSDRRSDRRYLGPSSHPQKSKRLYVLLKLQGKRDSESFILSKDGEMKLILH